MHGGHTLHRSLIAVLSALLVVLAMPAAPVRAAYEAKVVVIVGPVGSSTAHYKADAGAIVTEARRYTSNVVRVITPNATWAKVKAAAQGANVLVYLGHGNGWPSPYPPFQTNTKNGLGLDPSSGADSTRTVYYGEEWIRSSIRLAPNAVVLLYHLCYASGNTEPGRAVGSLADSRERIDGYGAGFIGAGARAVFAEGHPAHPATNYVRQLFTTNRTMEQVFRAAPTFHDNVIGPFPSQRTPGLEYMADPDTAAPAGFYRSLIGDLALTARAVTGPTLQGTGSHPADFVVPGAAEVPAGGAGLFASAAKAADPAANPGSTLDAGTRLRVTAEAEPAPDGTRILAVSVLGGSVSGFVRASSVQPRDSAAPVAWNTDESNPMLSPNGDGVFDELVVTTRFSESLASTLTVRNAAGTAVKSIPITGDIARHAWDLRKEGGDPVADGSYTWTLKGKDTWGNGSLTRTGSFVVDSTAPVSKAVAEATAGNDGWLVSPATLTVTAADKLSGVAYTVWRVDGGSASRYGDPVTYAGNGTRTFEYRSVDKAGIREGWRSMTLRIDTKPPAISLPASGKAGDLPDTWRSAVSIAATVTDAVSGVALKNVRIDGGDPEPLGASITVKGDGDHALTVKAKDQAGNVRIVTLAFRIDTTAPVIELPPAGGDGSGGGGAGEGEMPVPTVTPNGDGATESVTLPFTVSEAGRVTAVVTDAAGAAVRTLVVPVAKGAGSVAWDGRASRGNAVPDGRYTVTFTPRDAIGNQGEPVAMQADVYASLAALTRSPVLFFPQDGDTLARKTTASFTLLSPATVTTRVYDATGALVRTGPTDAALPAGPASWAWNGKRDDGSFAPRGVYRIEVAATNGSQAATLAVSVRADAFRLTTSVAEATRGKTLVVTAISGEDLGGAPTLVIRQPGLDPWTVVMTKAGGSSWTAKITLKKGGTAGTLGLLAKALDAKGGLNSSRLSLPIR
jgi:flagellar hook assembly protein FlgD